MKDIRRYIVIGAVLVGLILAWQSRDQNWYWVLLVVLLLEMFNLLWNSLHGLADVFSEILRLLEAIRQNTDGSYIEAKRQPKADDSA